MLVINEPRTGAVDMAVAGFGRGLSSGIQQLTQHKLNQVLEREQQTKYTNALQGLGYTPAQAQQLSQFSPELLAPIIKEQSRARVSQDMTSPGLQAIVPGLSTEEAKAIGKLSPGLQQAWYRNIIGDLAAPQEPAGMQQDFGGQAYQPTPYAFQQGQQPGASDLRALLQGAATQSPLISQLGQQFKQVTPAAPFIAPTLTPESNVVKELKSDEERRKEHAAQKEAEKSAKETRSKTVSERALEEKQRKAIEKASKVEKHEAEKVARKEQELIDKETKSISDKISSEAKSARDGLKRLNRMEKLIEEGGLPYSGWYNLLKDLEEKVPPTYGAAAGVAAGGTVGGPIGAAIGGTLGGLISPVATVLRSVQRKTSPNTEEFEKLTADFVKDAKQFFGSRLTDADLRAFMQTLPNLGQTDAGKKKVIGNLRSFYDASLLRDKAYKDILKENGGRRPRNLDILIEERIAPQIDALAEKFKEGIHA